MALMLLSLVTCVHVRGPLARRADLRLHVLSASEPNALLLDHLNLNHERGRHDLVCAFYYEVLGCAVDPRKADNLAAGRKGLWANAGIHQFHLSEGATAQVFDGEVTIAYDELAPVRKRLGSPPAVLADTAFQWEELAGGAELGVTDAWGTRFRLVERKFARDVRGRQPGDVSEACAIADIKVHVPATAPLDGIARFYSRALGCTIAEEGSDFVRLYTGSPTGQTLTFGYRPAELGAAVVQHEELSTDADGRSLNAGVHLSLYVADLPRAYAAVEALGAIYVNYRFSRQATNLEEAVEQCMFRLLDIVDPDDPQRRTLFKLEHEVRSAVKADGVSKYKSCPLDIVPQRPWTPS